jgi:hypothetical protein
MFMLNISLLLLMLKQRKKPKKNYQTFKLYIYCELKEYLLLTTNGTKYSGVHTDITSHIHQLQH